MPCADGAKNDTQARCDFRRWGKAAGERGFASETSGARARPHLKSGACRLGRFRNGAAETSQRSDSTLHFGPVLLGVTTLPRLQIGCECHDALTPLTQCSALCYPYNASKCGILR